MKYRISHSTTYEYTDLVPVCQNITHLVPRNLPRQRCTYHRLVVKPAPEVINKRMDYFGNPVQEFALHEGHRSLRITAVSKVEVRPPSLPPPGETAGWETVRDEVVAARTAADLDAYQFCFDSPRVYRVWELAPYARESFAASRPLVEAAIELNQRIHQDFRYDKEATDVQTPVSDVFRNRSGVCQDLAHVAIGCLRSIGLPARYVSGYLRTIPPAGKPRLVGADASHAWIAVYCGRWGWLDFDPTNDCMPLDQHITLAWGRDYGDVAPVRGVFVGGGKHQVFVSVDVTPLDGTATGGDEVPE
ncbi:MAG: transglutaminase family protein [Planctomycetes bacterium]|nr:transglutaminase family protein [Planctomycetota bacterium]